MLLVLRDIAERFVEEKENERKDVIDHKRKVVFEC
jgi:hypothetical protein